MCRALECESFLLLELLVVVSLRSDVIICCTEQVLDCSP